MLGNMCAIPCLYGPDNNFAKPLLSLPFMWPPGLFP